jgi:hypothetical protein
VDLIVGIASGGAAEPNVPDFSPIALDLILDGLSLIE